jgi:mRNA interferase YafQ
LKVFYTSQFKKDFKRLKRQQKDISKFAAIVDVLASGKLLDRKFKEHRLAGEWKNHRDCHIEPDWILIYRITENELILERMGSHSELLKK